MLNVSSSKACLVIFRCLFHLSVTETQKYSDISHDSSVRIPSAHKHLKDDISYLTCCSQVLAQWAGEFAWSIQINVVSIFSHYISILCFLEELEAFYAGN